MEKAKPAFEKAKQTFEQALSELEGIVEKMEKGDMTLDQSIEMFQKGIELSNYCSRRLDEVEKRITILIKDDNGNIRESDFNEPGVSQGSSED
ncbi:MAG: exodeoxyribonuclease VII small subunit [Eubacteriales bacterium]|nr:exodeoxyribonuclease VII small subunit [Eubacteriales bacterium]